jgi:hypothetical protein
MEEPVLRLSKPSARLRTDFAGLLFALSADRLLKGKRRLEAVA